ncbi:uncharacterized protein LOC130628771 [Hydractinia symbiolongicarpus]|uniref:uncharacterized protein LOC130628771 n=1 Tax=Hydractinia symbiolongicarpus TaxID=13093 RepID=UPI0025517A20|nr:uncharacterized protein LOC130628771 [Hydractinia symbiolongicarpus]XP_057297762.1 uncharacterized protein LOC130628771 [Hydractinia symbiolongicarpus]
MAIVRLINASLLLLLVNTLVTSSPMFAVLKTHGLEREHRICNSRSFQFFLRIICSQHVYIEKPTAKLDQDSNFIENKSAHKFLKTRHSTPYQSTDQNYIDECCNHKKFGCNVHEIHGYCDSILFYKK